jgi:hypothetical protein
LGKKTIGIMTEIKKTIVVMTATATIGIGIKDRVSGVATTTPPVTLSKIADL